MQDAIASLRNAVAPILNIAQEKLHPLWLQAEPWVHAQITQANQSIANSGLEPWQVATFSSLATLGLVLVTQVFSARWRLMQEDGGLRPAFFAVLRSLPFVRGLVAREKAKIRNQLMASRLLAEHPPTTQLPAQGKAPAQVLEELFRRQKTDMKVADGASRLSGAVYMGSSAHRQMLNDAFYMFAITNPLHGDVWPSVRQMEAEVVSMTASFLGGGPGTEVCGAMTSGGSESILLAMKASRDWARARRGVRQPEMIIARSAHAAYIKAAEYFRIKLVVLPVGPDLRLSGRAVRAALTRNTAVVVASAPCYPHGVVDHVEDIARVCRKAGVCLHVDACLGGFVLAFAAKLGRQVPPFDFRVKGVTSLSIDTHKFGLAHKGSSVVLYANSELRAHQFTSITDWSGGLYISPTMAGSRPGGLIATAWAALISQGESGYRELARQLMEAADRFQEGIKHIPELRVLGQPDMCLVAFTNDPKTAPNLNMYKVKDLLGRTGWSCNALQTPPALHFCFTPAHVGGEVDVVGLLLEDLSQACQKLMQDPECVQGGSAPLYGVANVVPDRRMIGDFLVTYQECQLDV